MALNEDLVKNDADRGEGWRGETERSRLAPGPALGGEGYLFCPIHLGSLVSKGEDLPEDS